MTLPQKREPLRVAILQSNYIPWKGYFDIIHDVDLFVFHDDLQYTKNDWRNRNKISTSKGLSWLSIPVGTDEKRLITEVIIGDPSWQKKHWNILLENYSRAPYFGYYRSFLEEVYLSQQWKNLSELNQFLIEHISRDFLGITTAFSDSRQYQASGAKQERVVNLLNKVGATLYVSGQAAKDYIDETWFSQTGIELIWKDYAGYPEYPQFHPPFEHGVTILDLLFHTGPEAPYYIWGWRQEIPV